MIQYATLDAAWGNKKTYNKNENFQNEVKKFSNEVENQYILPPIDSILSNSIPSDTIPSDTIPSDTQASNIKINIESFTNQASNPLLNIEETKIIMTNNKPESIKKILPRQIESSSKPEVNRTIESNSKYQCNIDMHLINCKTCKDKLRKLLLEDYNKNNLINGINISINRNILVGIFVLLLVIIFIIILSIFNEYSMNKANKYLHTLLLRNKLNPGLGNYRFNLS